MSLGCFCFFFWSQLAGTISKPYQNHIKIVSKSYQNHIEIITPNSKHIKFISSNRIQNHIKIVKNIFPEFSILEGFRCHKAIPNTYQYGKYPRVRHFDCHKLPQTATNTILEAQKRWCHVDFHVVSSSVLGWLSYARLSLMIVQLWDNQPEDIKYFNFM